MNSRFRHYAGLAAMILVGEAAVAHTEEPVRLSGAPIIFSAPKSDTVSSNLNQLESKGSPFKGLESDLKKPFQIFDAGRSDGNFRPPSILTDPPAAPVNNRRAKELMDKRAEMMLLDPDKDNGDPDLTDDDPLKASEEALAGAGKKPKTALDRYYDRLDRERSAVTNSVQNTDLYGNKKDPDGKEKTGHPFAENLFDNDRQASLHSLGRLSNNVSDSDGGGFFSDTLKPKTFTDLSDFTYSSQSAERSLSVKEVKQTRLDDFKRLLGTPAPPPRNSDYSPGSPAFGTAQRPSAASTTLPAWSSATPPANPGESFSSRAGLVGAPAQLQSLPSFSTTTPGLNSTPPPVPPTKPPTSSFSIPKRQF